LGAENIFKKNLVEKYFMSKQMKRPKIGTVVG
jgi:hypothetical protein